jgi:hypothetical protein
MAVLGLAAPKRGLRRTENPRVGGSIPPLATTPNWSVRVTWVTFYSGGARQDCCRVFRYVQPVERSGFKTTGPTGAQLRMPRAQRSGLAALARS